MHIVYFIDSETHIQLWSQEYSELPTIQKGDTIEPPRNRRLDGAFRVVSVGEVTNRIDGSRAGDSVLGVRVARK